MASRSICAKVDISIAKAADSHMAEPEVVAGSVPGVAAAVVAVVVRLSLALWTTATAMARTTSAT
jgi:hypothetical protein